MLKFVVDVVERHDPEAGVRGYAQRFEFTSAQAALSASESARAAGFDVRVERVQERQRVNA